MPEEILPRLYHWTSYHEGIGRDVSSYYLADGATLVDPMVPEGGLDWFRDHGGPAAVVLTNRHHYRHSARFVEAFGCPVHCHEAGLHEFEGGPRVEGFSFGDRVAPGILALEMDAICAEDTALHLDVGGGALAFADALIRYGGNLGFVPDVHMGDDPEAVKRGVRESLRRLIEREFDHLLFAHGEPLVGGGKAALRRFVAGGAA